MNNAESIFKAIQQLPSTEKRKLLIALNRSQQIHTRSSPQALDLGPFRRTRCPHCGK